jgi:Holliday junction resolvase RusA-like endonuclease
MPELRFTVPGEPQVWERAGVDTRRGRPQHYKPKATARHEERLAELAAIAAHEQRVELPLRGALRLHVRAVWPSIAAFPKAALKATRPDFDNALKVVDGLNVRVLEDDGRIAVAAVEKWYAGHDEEPRTEIVIGTLEDLAPRACPFCRRSS